MTRFKSAYLALLTVVLSPTAVQAVPIVADVNIDFFDSGAGPLAGPYGGTLGGFPVSVPLTYATDGDASTFLSLPTGSYVTVGFSSGFVIDGPGNDLFISEVGAASELANIFVSTDFGTSFTLLGTADGGTLTELDLADIGFTGMVNAVRVVGLDNGGGSPGFDVSFVQGLEGSVVMVTEPGTLALLGIGLVGMGLARRRRKV